MIALSTHFYHKTIRRCVVAFGNMFNEIVLVKYENGSFNELSRVTVPLSYSGNENFAQRLYGNPDLPTAVQIKLPRMSFEMMDIAYDPSRKLSIFNTECGPGANNNVENVIYSGAPYNVYFDLDIYVRNIEDGAQIVEQILPYFNPDYTLAMQLVDSPLIVKNIPLVLESVSHENDYIGGEEQVRYVRWNLKFVMKTYFYGPTNPAGTLIRHITANTHIMGANSNTPIVIQTVDPDPLNAGPQDAYGFTEVIIEKP